MEDRTLSLELRPRRALPAGLAPAGPLRDQQAEKRRALANAMNKTLAAANKPDGRVFTSATRGEATTRYKELADASQLKVTTMTPKDLVASASARKARLAAAARWQKARKAVGIVAPAPTPATILLPSQTSAVPEGTRLVRRGEFEGLKAGYRGYSSSELLGY
eukprot:4797050-Prymnesium_polylepis.1